MASSQISRESENMGQGALCSLTAPQIDSLSPMNSQNNENLPQSQTKELPSDILEAIGELLQNKTDLKSEDLLLKLRMVIQENLELKDTITQSNLALRQQMNLLVQWNRQVEKMQLQHRQELDALNKKFNSLVQENNALKSTLSDFKGSDDHPKFQDLDDLIQNLREGLDLSESRLQQTLQEKDALTAMRTKLEGEVTLFKCDLASRRGEFERISWQNQRLHSTVKELQERLQQTSKRSINMEEKDSVAKDEVLKLEKLLLETKGINNSLICQLQDARNKIEYLEAELKVSRESSKLRPRNPQSPSKDDNLKGSMLPQEVNSVDIRNGRSSDERDVPLQNLQGEVRRLKKELSETKGRSEIHQINDHYYQTKIKSIQELHDEATAKIISYEELLGTKNEEIGRLKRDVGQMKAQLTEMKSEGETIAVLRAQVEVYQSDFRAERESREAMANERERLRDEIKHLQARNTQLADELDTYQRRQFNQSHVLSSRSGSEEPHYTRDAGTPSPFNPDAIFNSRSSVSPDKTQPKREDPVQEIDEDLFYCPKCNKSFQQLRPLEEHVNMCLDED